MKICSKCKLKEAKIYSVWCRDCCNSYNKIHYLKHKDRFADRQRKYYQKNPIKFSEIRRINNLRKKKKAIEHYSRGKMCCNCCGEKNLAFLTLDHINGDGSKHRKLIGTHTKLSSWTIRNNFPSGFQVLCFNCNIGKSNKSICPHKNPENYEV